MDLVESMRWQGRRVWLQSSPAITRQYGQVLRVTPHSLLPHDLHVVVRLDDGAFTTLQGSHKGARWDFAD